MESTKVGLSRSWTDSAGCTLGAVAVASKKRARSVNVSRTEDSISADSSADCHTVRTARAAPSRSSSYPPHPGHIGQVECRDLGAQVAVVAITSVGQHHPARQTGRAGPAQLVKRNLRLGFECDVRGHMRLAPARRIGRPFLRQIK